MALRPRFIRTDEFVVVKPIRLSSADSLEAGTEIKLGEYRLHQLKRWYRRRRIARAGSEWAKNVLAGRRGASVMDRPPLPEPEVAAPGEQQEEVVGRRIESSGQWHTVYEGGKEVAKLRGKKALETWLEENPHA